MPERRFVCSLDELPPGGMKLVELAPGVTLDEVKSKTEAAFDAGLFA